MLRSYIHSTNDVPKVRKKLCSFLIVVKVYLALNHIAWKLSFDAGGVAWDWINENLYWADPWTREIGVFDPSTGDRRVLFDVDSPGTSFGPRALVIDPVNA